MHRLARLAPKPRQLFLGRFKHTLVSPEWVVDSKIKLSVLDCGSLDGYLRGHVPNALHFGLPSKDPKDPFQVISEPYFRAYMDTLPIDDDTTLVFYDDSNHLVRHQSIRAWWISRYYGVKKDQIKILNGGFRYWVENDFEVSCVAPTQMPPSTDKPTYTKNAARVIALDELKSIVADDANTVQLLDTRSIGEFTGANPNGNARAGHIPRALHLEWSQVLKENGQFKSTDELADLVAKTGLSPDKPVVTYCQRGIRAAHTAFVLEELLGFPTVRVYEGSMLEYLNVPDTKVSAP
ncbi:Aste57867_7961 [Aphanomyces stellatus]|uniref:Aste57867_7961 protein n=1 Tax=Aphanomyces stellatus TaxID=120398 RepID=A0A485KJ23_9STRA|nr:hypothetical protein As57867_007931 [Aphanomyces stellatus]VFT84854.1 Aste57867_7961 [Aphanomyces stellatus]